MTDSIEIRNYQPQDLPALVELINEADACDRLERATTLQEMGHEMEAPGYFPETDCFMAWENGRLAGYADLFFRNGTDDSNFYTWGVVRPDRRRRGLGLRLMALLHGRALERLGEVTHGTAYLVGGMQEGEAGRQALFEAAGMERARYYVNMARPLNGNLPPVETPRGYRLRPMDLDRDVEAMWQVRNLAFRDHWGAGDVELEEFKHFWIGAPGFRPDITFVAEDEATGHVVGFSLNKIEPDWIEKTGRREGYVQTLAVVRQARRHGLGAALLVHTMHVLRRAGMEGIHLNADAENLTGAIRLYERVGFSVRKQFVNYRKQIHAGDRP